ncbi:MAG: hypothetical protein J6X24_08375 [Firmicutes bacterium]|nr:hypothetical protein [Bacillota bacterium]
MARQKESLEMYLTEEQIEYIKSLPEEERQAETEKLLGIRRFENGAVDLTTIPGKRGDFFRKKQLLLNPESIRDEEGLFEKRLSDDNYFEATCPFCGTTAEHEGKGYRYSKKTKNMITRDAVLMALIGVLVALRALNVILALVAITLVTMDLSTHARRKMYYSVTCRKCGAHFPLDEDELEKLKAELAAKAEAEEVKDQAEELAEQYEKAEETTEEE